MPHVPVLCLQWMTKYAIKYPLLSHHSIDQCEVNQSPRFHFPPKTVKQVDQSVGANQSLCKKRFMNKHTFNSHRTGIHDGDDGRLGKLVCSCKARYQSRHKFQPHTSKHKQGLHLCTRCDSTFVSSKDLDKHLDVHEKSLPRESLHPTSSDQDTFKVLSSFKTNLVSHTGKAYERVSTTKDRSSSSLVHRQENFSNNDPERLES
ncbi:hypothetical protein EDD21DRAFT_357387 [Dissophora ornata]|nr:hypothetical protein EDD21DRAFT_357387 [Dissophora ornata]